MVDSIDYDPIYDESFEEIDELEINFDIEDINLESNFKFEELDLEDFKPILKSPERPIKTALLRIPINGNVYEYYLFLKDDNFVQQYKNDILSNRNTLAYLYPNMENVYNGRFLDYVNKKGYVEYFLSSEFTKDMDDSIKEEDDVYNIVRNYLKIFTIREGDKKVEI